PGGRRFKSSRPDHSFPHITHALGCNSRSLFRGPPEKRFIGNWNFGVGLNSRTVSSSSQYASETLGICLRSVSLAAHATTPWDSTPYLQVAVPLHTVVLIVLLVAWSLLGWFMINGVVTAAN